MIAAVRASARAGELSLLLDGGVRYLTLNALWTAGCLTVLGAPASTAALHAVVAGWSGGDERGVTGRFVAALRVHGVRATVLAVLAVPVLALFVANLWLTAQMGSERFAVAGALLAVGVPLVLLLAMLPAALVAGPATARDVVALAGTRLVHHPLVAVLGVVLAAAVVLAIALFPPLALVVPSIAARLHRAALDRFIPEGQTR